MSSTALPPVTSPIWYSVCKLAKFRIIVYSNYIRSMATSCVTSNYYAARKLWNGKTQHSALVVTLSFFVSRVRVILCLLLLSITCFNSWSSLSVIKYRNCRCIIRALWLVNEVFSRFPFQRKDSFEEYTAKNRSSAVGVWSVDNSQLSLVVDLSSWRVTFYLLTKTCGLSRLSITPELQSRY